MSCSQIIVQTKKQGRTHWPAPTLFISTERRNALRLYNIQTDNYPSLLSSLPSPLSCGEGPGVRSINYLYHILAIHHHINPATGQHNLCLAAVGYALIDGCTNDVKHAERLSRRQAVGIQHTVLHVCL